MAPTTSTSFKVSNHAPGSVIFTPMEEGVHPASHSANYRGKCSKILQGTTFPSHQTYSDYNGFVHTIVDSYNNNHNLVIRPDDVWVAIITQFSFYVNAKGEQFRRKFVNFSGKLAVNLTDSIYASYDTYAEKITHEIHNSLDPDVKDWILPNFTTTTKDDVITCGVILMAIMKNYFNLKSQLRCGIPFVRLEGTIEDWTKIKEKLVRLHAFDLTEWVNFLDPILDEFIKAKNGREDEDFWGRICDHRIDGSGVDVLSGWVTAFTLFNETGRFQGTVYPGHRWPFIELDDVTSGNVEIDVLINCNDGVKKAALFAGHMATEVQEDNCTVQPKSGWALALKNGQE